MIQRTLSIIKPDAVENSHVGAILNRFEKADLRIVSTKMLWLSKYQAEKFYEVHKEKPFFDSLVAYMTSGPVVVSVLEGENAIQVHRFILGATNPQEAEDNTIRKDFGEDIERNAAHGSDGVDTANVEIIYFFNLLELFNYTLKK